MTPALKSNYAQRSAECPPSTDGCFGMPLKYVRLCGQMGLVAIIMHIVDRAMLTFAMGSITASTSGSSRKSSQNICDAYWPIVRCFWVDRILLLRWVCT